MDIISYFNALTPHHKFWTIIALATIAALIFRFIIKDILAHWASKTETKADDIIVEKTSTAIFLLIFVIGFQLALPFIEAKVGTANHVVDSMTILLVMYIVMVVTDIITAEIARRIALETKSKIDQELLPLISKGIKIIAFIVAALFILHEWEIDIKPVLAGLGVAGIAVAFAMQSTLENLFGGASMLLDKNIKIGDTVKLDTGESGTIHDVGLRSTKIRTFDNEELIVPNGQFAKSRITNFVSLEKELRAVIEFNIAYGTDLDKVKKTVKKTISSIKGVRKDPPVDVFFMEFSDSSLKFRTVFWVNSFSERFAITEKARCDLYNSLNKAKINIPFPTHTIHIKEDKKR